MTSSMETPRRKVITGEWDGQPIWRYETPEDMLTRMGISPEVAALWTKLNGGV